MITNHPGLGSSDIEQNPSFVPVETAVVVSGATGNSQNVDAIIADIGSDIFDMTQKVKMPSSDIFFDTYIDDSKKSTRTLDFEELENRGRKNY